MNRVILALALALTMPAALADADRGKQLHDQHCLKCHGTEVYSRADRFIGSRDALRKQVDRCKLNVGAQWFDADVDAVVDYLDKTFYQFN